MVNQFSGFLSQINPETLIIYGNVTEPERVLAALEGSAEELKPLTNRYALLAPSIDDLRLSSLGWIDITMEQRMALTNARDLFQFCRGKILRGVSQFAKPTNEFVVTYLDFVWSQIKTYKGELEDGVGASELFGIEDWVFSAWLPLPHANILLPREFEPGAPQFAEIDIVFWHKGRIKAVVIEGTSTPIKSKQYRREYLCENHPFLDIISVNKDWVAKGLFPKDAFSVPFCHYWRDLTLPIGPAPPLI